MNYAVIPMVSPAPRWHGAQSLQGHWLHCPRQALRLHGHSGMTAVRFLIPSPFSPEPQPPVFSGNPPLGLCDLRGCFCSVHLFCSLDPT